MKAALPLGPVMLLVTLNANIPPVTSSQLELGDRDLGLFRSRQPFRRCRKHARQRPRSIREPQIVAGVCGRDVSNRSCRR